MKQGRLLFVLVFFLAVCALPLQAAEAQAEAEQIVLDLGAGEEIEAVTATEAGVCAALEPHKESALEPAAICRMRPQCDVDADCDAFCAGAGGDCVRARCPIRVCRCG